MPAIVPRLCILLMTTALLLVPALTMVPQTASATPIVVDHFTDGSTGARLGFPLHPWNDSLALELPRGARIKGAELTVAGVEGGTIGDTAMDFATDPIGDDLWALVNIDCSVYPPDVDPYESGWRPFKSTAIPYIIKEDNSSAYSETTKINSTPPFYYSYQLFHFHPDPLPAVSYTVRWNGYGTCTANQTAIYQAEMWLYDHRGSAWERTASYASNAAGDVWLESTFLATDDFVTANGSVDAIVTGPHSLAVVAPPASANAQTWTDYIGLAIACSGGLEYPQNATLRLGGQRLNLSDGQFKGQLELDDALGFKDALQAAVDAEVVMPGNVIIPLNFSVEWRSLSSIDVGPLRVEYEPIVNAPPVWRGPTTVEVEEDSPWTEALDLGAAFSDDWNQEELRFAIVNVSDPANLSIRMQFGSSGNWTLTVRPVPDFFGEITVSLNATDLFGEVAVSPAISVRVTQVPDRPTVEDPGELHMDEGARLLFTPRASDPDMPDDVLTWSDASDLLDVDPTNGTIDWTPGKDQVGTHRIKVVVTDRFGLQGTITLTVVVANINDPPVITSPLALEVYQDQAVVYDIVATDPDVPFGDLLTYYASSVGIDVQVDATTGRVTFTPTNDDVGLIEISIGVQDRATVKDDRTLAVTVLNVNDPPLLQGPGPQMHDQGETVSVRFVATDPDLSVAGAGERIALTSDGPGFLSPNTAGWVNRTFEQIHVGIWWVNYTLTDAAGLLSRIQIVWTIIDVNDLPRGKMGPLFAGPIDDIYEGELVTFNVTAWDPDGDTLTWTDDTSLFDIDASTGEVSFTPEQKDVGMYHIRITVTDSRGGSDYCEFNFEILNVNDAPVIGNVAPLSGTSYKEGETISFLASATDKDGDTLTLIWKEGARELGRGSPFATSSLKPGRHTITLVVDDGNATVESHLDVVVKERAGGIGPMAILLVVAIVAAVAIAAVALAMRSRKDKARALADQQSASLAWPEGAAGGAAAKAPEGEEPPKIEIEYREV